MGFQSFNESSQKAAKTPANDSRKKIMIAAAIIIVSCLVCYLTMCTGGGSNTPKKTEEPYDKIILMVTTEDIVKQFLKSPSTAKFPSNSEWSITDNGQEITVRSYVDAQNSFGAMIRSDFIARYSLPDVELIYLMIDGEVMYTK